MAFVRLNKRHVMLCYIRQDRLRQETQLSLTNRATHLYNVAYA